MEEEVIGEDLDQDQVLMIETEEEDVEVTVTVVRETETRVARRIENVQRIEKKRRAAKSIRKKDVDLLLGLTDDKNRFVKLNKIRFLTKYFNIP